MKIALTGRLANPRIAERILRLTALLEARGASLCCSSELAEMLEKAAGTPCAPKERFSGGLPADVSMLLALGGDGTFLGSLELLAGRDIPVAGINLGRLGFLTSAAMDSDSPEWVDDLLQGRYSLIEREILKVEGTDALPDGFFPYALNEFSLHREQGGMLPVCITVDGSPLPTFWADGVLIATPTGSTAYSLSLGGPVVFPGSGVTLITPLAPHNLNVRPLVIPPGATVGVSFPDSQGNVILTADSRPVVIPCGETLSIKRGEFTLKCISFGDNNFIKALTTKLFWGEDRRNNTI
ncbi:MAG: NAD(+)/NADH kinase [Bacteroidales bacterium]|nr:NAD(+)/NADH kinase [Bacteroidales bacterium]